MSPTTLTPTRAPSSPPPSGPPPGRIDPHVRAVARRRHGAPATGGWPARLWRGPADEPAWARPALLVLLAGTAVLSLWNLSASGYANEYYAAAVQAGTDSTWSAAVTSAQSAASLELASGTAVMSLGGWSGSDSAVTLAQFQAAVDAGEVRYYVDGGQRGGPDGDGGTSTSAEIAAWVEANFSAQTVGGQTVYDLAS